VRAVDTAGAGAAVPAQLRVAGAVEMGRPAPARLHAGEAMRIPTGGMLPAGADAVVMVEHTVEPGDGTVRIARAAAAGQHVMRRGEDMRRGAVLLAAGHRCRPHDVGALAGIGASRVLVYRRPRVALIATGNEIVPPEVTPKPGQVRSINQYALRAMIVAEGGEALDLGVVPDRHAAITRALTRALRTADAVLLSGGSSVGIKDLTPAVIRALPRARVLVHGIRIKPGKPTLIARVGTTPVLGLPGHPVSALVVFEIFGAPLVRRLGGEPEAQAFAPRVRIPARLATAIVSTAGRDDWVRVRLEERDGEWIAHPLAGGSAEIASFVHADGMLRIHGDTVALDAGARVVVHRFC
jgi:molybdopterin molybdotransferase